jgi:hypothetical protein
MINCVKYKSIVDKANLMYRQREIFFCFRLLNISYTKIFHQDLYTTLINSVFTPMFIWCEGIFLKLGDARCTGSSKKLSRISKFNIYFNTEQNSRIYFRKCVETLKIRCYILIGLDVSSIRNSNKHPCPPWLLLQLQWFSIVGGSSYEFFSPMFFT